MRFQMFRRGGSAWTTYPEVLRGRGRKKAISVDRRSQLNSSQNLHQKRLSYRPDATEGGFGGEGEGREVFFVPLVVGLGKNLVAQGGGDRLGFVCDVMDGVGGRCVCSAPLVRLVSARRASLEQLKVDTPLVREGTAAVVLRKAAGVTEGGR